MKAKLQYLHHDGRLFDSPLWRTDKPVLVIEEGAPEYALAAINSGRELVLAAEFMRSACEHADGRSVIDRARLSHAMSVGIRAISKFNFLAEDFKRPSYWADVRALPEEYGIAER